MSDMNYKGLLLETMIARIPLDIRCPSRHRIRNDMLGQASRRRIGRHGDLQFLRRFPLRAFSVWPGFISNVVRRATSTDNITRRDSWLDDGSRRKYMEMPPSSIALTDCALPRRISICSRALQ
jgi:hypothetical protein